MVTGIEAIFPRLRGATYQVTSARDDVYNCIAWAAGVTTDWWWPVGSDKTFWPTGVPRAVTLEAFHDAFATLGYQTYASEEPELGFEKIALFANDKGEPKHAARQLPNGRWTSKLGKMEDIEHDLHDLTGTVYGSVVLVMKRPVATTAEGPTESEAG